MTLTKEDAQRAAEQFFDSLPDLDFSRLPSVADLSPADQLRRQIALYERIMKVNRLQIEDCATSAVKFPWQAHHQKREAARLKAGNEGLAARLTIYRAALLALLCDEATAEWMRNYENDMHREIFGAVIGVKEKV